MPHQRPLGGSRDAVHRPGRLRGARRHFSLPGYQVPPWYDHLVAKLIVTGRNRAEGLRRMERALGELQIEGIATNIDSQKKIISHPVFRKGEYGTGFLGDILKEGGL